MQKPPKYSKDTKGDRTKSVDKMQGNGQIRDPAIIDMSHTINAPPPSTSGQAINQGNRTVNGSNPAGSGVPMEEGDPVNRDIADERGGNTQQIVRDLVQESVGREMQKIYAAIGKLSETVASLANNRTQPEAAVPMTNTDRSVASRVSTSPPTYRSDGGSDHPQNHMPFNNGSQGHNRGFKIERFGLNFNGNPNGLSVDDFVYRVEYFQKHYRLSWEEIMDEIHILLSGPALEWFWLQQRNKTVSDWPSLKYAMSERYRTRRSCFEEMRDILERKQLPGESIDAFFHDLNLMRSKLERPVSEYEMIGLAKRNLRKSLSSIVYSMNVSSLEQLRVECLEIEKTFFKKDFQVVHPPMNRAMRVNEITDENDDFEPIAQQEILEEVEAITNVIICWNCQTPGHIFRDCPSTQRNLFCFKCGKPNTTSPKCINCRTGNGRKNLVTAGNQRSTERPAMPTQQN